MKRFYPALFCCCLGFSLAAQTVINGVVNVYTPVSSFVCDSSSLVVGNSTGFSAGDKVLLVQMKGAAVSLANNATFGDVTDTGNAGNYEFNRIASISGNEIRLQFALIHSYDVAGKVQLVRVPEYDNVTANNLTCKAWDGTTGGVLAIDVAGTLTLQGNIDVSAKGFRGGMVFDTDNAGDNETQYFYPFSPALSAEKGEGTALIPVNQSFGRGKAATGGGGGNAHNAGGGGGANGGSGGNGGLEYFNTPGSPTPGTNGVGGAGLFNFSTQKILLGGGGGAGHTNDNVGTSGGQGGGIVLLKANALEANGFKIMANGADVVADGTNRNDGQGGGGAGGTVLLLASQVTGNLTLELKGGNGGNCLFFVQSQIIGPGGGGNGGKLAISQLFPNVTVTLNGGQNGIANQNMTNGAQPGQPGSLLFPLLSLEEGTLPAGPMPDLGPDVILCVDSTVVFDAGPGFASYLWQDGSTGQTFAATAFDIYWVEVTDSCGNTQRDSVLLTGNLINDTQFGDVDLCAGASLTLTLPGFDNYAWAPAAGLSCTDCADVTIQPAATTTYTLLATTNDGCVLNDTFIVTVVPLPERTETIEFCPGGSATVLGMTYTQPITITDILPASGAGCDTIVTYILKFSPVDLTFRFDDLVCNNGQIDLHYTICNLGSGPAPAEAPVTFYDADPTLLAASVLGTYTINTAGLDSCATGVIADVGDQMFPDGAPPGTVVFSVVNFDGSLPTPFSFNDFPVTGIEECNYENNQDDLMVQFPVSPVLNLGPDVALCTDDSTVVFDAGPGFVSYLWQDGSTDQTFAATAFDYYWVEVTDACGFKQRDTVLLTVSLINDTQFGDVDICAGESLFLTLPGFDSYTWSPAAGLSCTDCADVVVQPAETTTYTLLAITTDGCVLNDSFTVTVIPLPTRAETIDFCKGDTVLINGMAYTQPGTVQENIPATIGCDTIVTYTLQYIVAPNASISIQCVDDINIATQSGTGPVVVDYALPTFASDCPCPGVSLSLTAGLPPGSTFPLGETEVCYEVSDSCGNAASCCFIVNIREALPCDVKVIGCMKYELLEITRNTQLEKTYRIRVTNNCPNPMTYVAIQLPAGVAAVKPANLSVFTTQDGRNYDVRNPNFSPFYSIRYKSTADSISNGESDIFYYTLPPQATPDYIHITARLEPQVFYEAHLNTFNCPVLPEDDMRPAPDAREAGPAAQQPRVFPNPTSGELFADLSEWEGQQVQVNVLDSRGAVVQSLNETADFAPQAIRLPSGLTNGLYVLDVRTADGRRQAMRFVLQR
jgi:hypothetical protein